MGGICHALELTVTPGSLLSKKEDLRYCKDATLVLKGNADVRDLEQLRFLTECVKTLDMKDLHIDAYNSSPQDIMGVSEFNANEIPPYAFLGSLFENVILPSNTSAIGRHAFAGSNISRIDIPNSLNRIDDFAFLDCDNLNEINISTVNEFGDGVFKGCKSLRSADISSHLTSVPSSMFDGCVLFESAIPPSVYEIGAYSYRNTALETLELKNVKKIGAYAFSDMPYLKSVLLNDEFDVDVSEGVFFNDRMILSLPRINNDLAPLLYSHSGGHVRYSISAAIIGEGAFSNMTNLDTAILGANVRQIQKDAFRNTTGLKTIDVTSLGTTMPSVDASSFSGLENENGRYDIKLNVLPDTEEEWKQHPVWGLFDVAAHYTGLSTSIEEVADISITNSRNIIWVKAVYPLDLVEIFNVGGECVFRSQSGVNEIGVDVDLSEPKIVRVVSGGVLKIVKVF